jgi:hypothetical protein
MMNQPPELFARSVRGRCDFPFSVERPMKSKSVSAFLRVAGAAAIFALLNAGFVSAS